MRSWMLAVCLVALVGCGDESASPDADAGAGTDAGTDIGEDAGASEQDAFELTPLTMVEWCRDSNEVWCEWMFGCFDTEDLNRARDFFGFTDQESCERFAVGSCQTRTIVGVNEGRQVFDGVAAAECVEEIAGEACNTFDALADNVALNPEECFDVTLGQVEQGEECVTNGDCAAPDSRCGEEERCTGQLGRDAFLLACTPDDAESRDACAGLLCLRIAEGAGENGICSHECRIDEHCGPGAGCFEDRSGTRFCLAECESDAECGGFRCVDTGDGRKGCIVER